MLGELLGFPMGPWLVAAGSAVALLIAMRRRPGWIAWLVGIAGPVCVALAMYLWPLLLYSQEETGDYGAWVALFVVVGTGAGWLANALVALLLWARRRMRRAPAGR